MQRSNFGLSGRIWRAPWRSVAICATSAWRTIRSRISTTCAANPAVAIDAVDCVTKWQLEATCEQISEAWLRPVIESLPAALRFRIRGSHADNGSEYINHQLAGTLDKLNCFCNQAAKQRFRQSPKENLTRAQAFWEDRENLKKLIRRE